MATNLDEIAEQRTVTEILFERVLKENRHGPLLTEQLKDIYHMLNAISSFEYKRENIKLSSFRPERVTAFYALKKIGAANLTGDDNIIFLTPFGKELDSYFKRERVYERRIPMLQF